MISTNNYLVMKIRNIFEQPLLLTIVYFSVTNWWWSINCKSILTIILYCKEQFINSIIICWPDTGVKKISWNNFQSMADDKNKTEEDEKEADRKDKAKQRRSRTNFRLVKIFLAAVMQWNIFQFGAAEQSGEIVWPDSLSWCFHERRTQWEAGAQWS